MNNICICSIITCLWSSEASLTVVGRWVFSVMNKGGSRATACRGRRSNSRSVLLEEEHNWRETWWSLGPELICYWCLCVEVVVVVVVWHRVKRLKAQRELQQVLMWKYKATVSLKVYTVFNVAWYIFRFGVILWFCTSQTMWSWHHAVLNFFFVSHVVRIHVTERIYRAPDTASVI